MLCALYEQIHRAAYHGDLEAMVKAVEDDRAHLESYEEVCSVPLIMYDLCPCVH